MKLLLDQGLPRSAAEELRAAGIDAVHTGDIGLASASDSTLLELAREQGRAIITLDADFHALLALSNAQSPSVVRIRIEGLRAKPLAQLILALLSEREADLQKGALLTVQPRKVRIRYLPIVRPPKRG
jgi:predicted nuclease of predicted toxin-antitoxin system